MAEFYEMPAISPTMEVGTLLEWRVAEGASFASGAVVAEIGTDKANMEAEIFDAGVLLKHLVAEGDEVPPGFPIAIWGKAAGEDIAGLLTQFAERKASLGAVAAAGPAPAAKPAALAPSASLQAVPAAATDASRHWMGTEIGRLFADPPGDLRFNLGPLSANGGGTARVAASPLARKLAQASGVDLGRLSGTGPGGRITARDVEEAPRGGVSSPSPTREAKAIRNSPMRKTIARRLLESHSSIPTFFLTATFDAAGFVRLREQLKLRLPDLKASYNDMLVMAVARALREHPEVNASWNDHEIVQHGRVDIGIAVAVPDGLITPVVRNADGLTLSAVADTIRGLAKKARDQKLLPEEYTGATFTISNLGMMAIEQFTAIINPPEAAILAVGALEHVPVVVNGDFEVGARMKVTMTCDHRVIDGAVGAAFLQTLRKYVESPELLLV